MQVNNGFGVGVFKPSYYDKIEHYLYLVLNRYGVPTARGIRIVYFLHPDAAGDLDIALHLYRYYRDFPAYAWFCRDDGESIAVKVAKRGNDVYCYRVRRRVESFVDGYVKDDFVFAGDPRSPVSRFVECETHFLFVNLTFSCSPVETYKAAKETKKFLDRLRKALGRVCAVAWGLHLQESRKLHYDAVIFVERPIKVRWWWSRRRKRYVLVIKDKELFELIKSKWPHGFVNVEGVASLKQALQYVLKYCLKGISDELLNTVCLLYRKRSYYIAPARVMNRILSILKGGRVGVLRRSLEERLDSESEGFNNMNNCDLSSCDQASKWRFMGVFPAWRFGFSSPRLWRRWVLPCGPPL